MQAALEYYSNDIEKANEALNNILGQGIQLEDITLNILRAENSGNIDLLNQEAEYSKAQRRSEDAETDYLNSIQAAENFKENMSFEEAQALRDAYTWGENGIMAWSDFYAMSYEQQEAYIQSLSENYLQTMADSKALAIAEGQETV
jgi:hypothetical protein